MLWRTRAQRWLAAIVAVSTAVALQAASVRAIECARAKALVGAAWAEAEHATGASTSHGGAASLAGEDASVGGDERGTCLSVVVLAPSAPSAFAFPGAFDVVPSAARARARRLPSGLERPPRLA